MSCRGLVKTLMFFVNFIFSLIGLGIFIVGVLGVVSMKQIISKYPNLDLPNYVAPTVMIIGTVVFFISFSGCCGAIKEINCLLVMYTIVMLLLAVAKIVASAYLLTNKATALSTLNGDLHEVNFNDVSDKFHALEFLTKCCGTTGPNSYINANVTIPVACCPLNSDKPCNISNEDIYKQGCQEVAPPKIEMYFNAAIYSLMGIAVFELLSMMTAVYLTCYRKKGDYYEYD